MTMQRSRAAHLNDLHGWGPSRVRPPRRLVLATVALGGPVACIPYAVGTTAQPLPAGEGRAAMTAYRIPRGLDVLGDSSTDRDNAPFTGIDMEYRYGLPDGADVGFRVPSSSGMVVSYKRRLAGGESQADAAVSMMPAVGVVNWLSHAHVEMTLMGSAARWRGITPYGGARFMQTVPLDPDAVQDTPTAGGYLGFRFGNDAGGLAAELGVYHDKSALGLRRGSTIFIPSITIDGDLLETLRDAGVLDGLGRRRR